MGRKRVDVSPIRGERLKDFLKEQGITQAALADMIHISQQTISKIVQGKANLTEQTARLIADSFPDSPHTFEILMGYDQMPTVFDSPLEFEKAWIKNGGGAHPLDSITVVEARICVALEKMNKKGWQLAVSIVETISGMPDLITKKGDNKNEST